MIRFTKKLLLLSFGLLIIFTFAFLFSDRYLNYSFNDENAVFIWGDSQIYHGIDIGELSNALNKKVYSSARRGAGVYDFLLFTQKVPENSEVIVSISKLAQIRRKEIDANRSGFSLWALAMLYSNNYSWKEITRIARNNIRPKKNISEESHLYQFKDSMEITLPISHFKNYYDEIPIFLKDKQNLYIIGIKKLISKNCNIVFVEFPCHPILEEIEIQSSIQKETDKFNTKIISLFNEQKIDTIYINKEKNIFKDLSHLNSIGAKYLSIKLGIEMNKHDHAIFYAVR